MATAKELWPLYLGIVLGALMVSATALMTPFVIGRATDTVVAIASGDGGDWRDLIWFAVVLLVIALANSLLTNIAGYFGDQMSVRLRAILSGRYFHKLLRLPQRYYDNELTGKIVSRLNRSITSITDFLQTFANSFFPTVITLLAVLVITAFYSPWLSLLLIIIYPTFVWLTALTSRKWQVWEKQKNDHYDIAGGRFAEVIGQMRVVKSFVAEKRELTGFNDHYDETLTLTKSQSAFWHRMDFWRRGALDVVFFGVYAIIFLQAARGDYSVGDMVLLIQLTAMARQPVTSMSYWVDLTQRAVVGSQEYFKVMGEVDEPNNALEAEPTAEIRWTDEDPVIAFDDVDFSYDDDQGDGLVLQDIDLKINRGERVAFVGESGGGKTTLVNLIMKLYPATNGEIRVHGQSVREVPTVALRKEIGVVFQDSNLFSGTIRENMEYGRPGATDEELTVAATRANAMSFIAKLPNGFDTEIGERGIKLSGGQKQRLSVARALLKDAPILILDEATSSLDTKAERAVQAGLEELMEGRTTLIIAHRLATVQQVDRIVVIDRGRIVETGTPADLRRQGGLYARLAALQWEA